ncbi:FHA domain-containing protein [Nocardia brasiliensis]|uniref:FHA domain-containing protein n=1 Tax=Nocardia brasiliensis TaxID=37326 RepID=UPI002458026E|nr:FHA domain-containing protein [Nocardia brasiliensis]
MRSKPSTVGIAPGNGLVARFGGIVVYLSGETASTERILGTIEAVAEFDRPGAALAQRLAAVVLAGTAEPQHFGVVAPADDGTLILLRGPVFAEINGAEGTRRLDGARALTWVDEIVREPFRRITLGAAGTAALKALPRTDLRAGIAPGGGFVLTAALRRATKTPRRPAETPPLAVDLTAHRARTAPQAAPSTKAPEHPATSADPHTHANTNRQRATPTNERGHPTTSDAPDTRANGNRSHAIPSNSAREPTAASGVSKAQQPHTANSTPGDTSRSSAQCSTGAATEHTSANSASRSAGRRTRTVEPESTAAAGITAASAADAAGNHPGAASAEGTASKNPAAAVGISVDSPLEPTAAAGFAAADSGREAGGAGSKGTASAKKQSASRTKKASSPSAGGSAVPRPTVSTDELEATAASGFGAMPEPTGESDAVAPSSATRSATGGNANTFPAKADRSTAGSSSNAAATQGTSPGAGAPSKKAGRSAAAAASASGTAPSGAGTTPGASHATPGAAAAAPGAPGATPGASAASPGTPGAAPGASAAYPRRPGRPLPRPRPPIGSKAAADRPLAWSQARQPGGWPEPVALHRPSENRGLRVMRPVLDRAVGALILENGTAYPLDRPYVIGRGPQADDAVRAATAAPIVIQRDRHVSRVHAYVSVDDGKVFVRDATDTSGTFIAPPGTDQWTRISTSPTELRPGWSVRISDRVLTYRPDDRQAS